MENGTVFLLGKGVFIAPNGMRQVGVFQKGRLSEGGVYRSDGTLQFQGKWNAAGEFIEGKTFDSTGAQVTNEINKVRDAELANNAALQRRKEEAEAKDLAYKNILSTMNAGQLFAKADELSSQGDTAKAREVLRTLVSRFPDHPLAATAAQQMATTSAASANAANGSTAGGGNNNNAASSGSVSSVSVQPAAGRNCWDALAKRE
jgi:hypothetical protein